MPKIKKQPVVLSIIWRDATSVDTWTPNSEVELACNLIQTVGILVSESRELICLALNQDLDGDAISCFINIPKAWLISREVLSVKKKQSRNTN